MSGARFPTAPEELSAAWLTEVLREAGVLGSASVVGWTAEPCGTGQLGDCHRLHLRYDRHDGAGPRTAVGKFPSEDPVSRGYAAQVGLYAKEVEFYRHLAPDLPVRTPHAFFADVGADGAEFLLLFEDLAPATPCDQIAGCTPDQAALALESAAALHAASWHEPALAQLSWLGGDPDRWMAIADVMPDLHARFVERYADELEPRYLAVADRLSHGISGWLATLREPTCLWHLDYRLDNMLFDAKGGEVPLAVVDWQSVTLGPGIADVSYFLGAGLVPDVRRRHEDDLLRHYHAALTAAGVADYPWERCRREYAIHAVLGMFTAINASVNVKRTERGDRMFLTMARRHGEQMLDLGTLDLIGA